MPEAVDRNPNLDACVKALDTMARLAERTNSPFMSASVAHVRLVLDALADYRARRATGGPPPPFTHSWRNVDSRPETAPASSGVCPVGCPRLCGRCTQLAKESR